MDKKSKILFCLCGGVGLVNVQSLIRQFRELDYHIKIVISQNVKHFINPNIFSFMDIEVYSDEFHFESGIQHIELAKWADLACIIPATANTIAKLTHGIADNLLLSTLSSMDPNKVLIIPAMNTYMWANAINQENVEKLKLLNYRFIGPVFGKQLCGDVGVGNLVANDLIIQHCKLLLDSSKDFNGYHIVVTDGGTEEYFDPIRFISNSSSGLMASAIVNNLVNRGAKVTFVLANNTLNRCDIDSRVQVVQVETAIEMFNAVKQSLQDNSIFISVAAVCDFRPKNYSPNKIKKDNQNYNFEMEKNIDIISQVRNLFPQIFIVGFACESENLLENMQRKFINKKMNLIVGNQVTSDNPIFNSNHNQITLYDGANTESYSQNSKGNLALLIVNKLLTMVGVR